MLRGAIAIAFGVLAVLWPGLTLLVLVGLFAAYALLGGIVSIAAAFRLRRTERKWWLPLLLGVISVAAGIYAVLAPSVTALVLVLVMAANAILTGVLDIAMAVRLRRRAARALAAAAGRGHVDPVRRAGDRRTRCRRAGDGLADQLLRHPHRRAAVRPRAALTARGAPDPKKSRSPEPTESLPTTRKESTS